MWHGLKSAGTLDERVQRGLDARQRVPHDAHTDLYRSQVRPDPLKLVLEQDQDRIPALIGVRHERMAKNVHSYLRGSDVVMAADLAVTPVSEIHVQACGDVVGTTVLEGGGFDREACGQPFGQLDQLAHAGGG